MLVLFNFVLQTAQCLAALFRIIQADFDDVVRAAM
jgi:hypothetical protein